MLCWSERYVAHCLLRALVGCAGLSATAHGYGIGYVYDQTGVSLNVTNYTHPGPGGIRTDSRAFASALERAMIFIERLLDSNTRSRL
ncbi:hypothetical protein T492DRAFT_905120 [Pavlovales sp. CCMP2436]|nr:hypothetical protein T492DRAFT_905120 [Pavlovales sp. CCMP2436]